MKMGRVILLSSTVGIMISCHNSQNGNITRSGQAAPSSDTPIIDSSHNTHSPDSRLQVVYSDSTYQLTGVAKADNGPLLVNYPRWSNLYKYAVIEQTGGDSAKPFPNEKMNTWMPGQDAKLKWVCVQSVYFDRDGVLWILDPSAPKLKSIQGKGAKLVRMNKANNTIERTYNLSGILPDTAYANDVRVDVTRQFAYITESKGGGILVVDLRSGKMRRVLANQPSTLSDPNFKFIIDGHELMKDGKPAKFNSDGIALKPGGDWLYYKPLSDDKLYRIATEHLRNWSLTGDALAAKVQDLGHFNTTDGMIFDKDGNLYMGDLQRSAIVKIDTNVNKTTLIQDSRLIWPDSYAIADGYLFISCSQIQKQPGYNNGINKRTTPYSVYRIKL